MLGKPFLKSSQNLKIDREKQFSDLKTVIDNRFNGLTLGFLGIIGVLVGGLLTILAKITFFPNP